MTVTPEQTASAVESLACPTCESPAGSPCRTRGGDTAFRYHTARFVRVPELAGYPEVIVPADRGPGHPWRPRPAPATAADRAGGAVRIGYASSTPASPGLREQVDALRAAGCDPVFREDASARVKDRPERGKALRLAVSGTVHGARTPVILAVHELGRLARSSAELMTTAAALQTEGIHLQVLTGPLAGVWDPRGQGSLLFDVLAAADGLDRNHRREMSVEGQRAAAAQGRRGGRPRVFDEHMTAAAVALREQGMGVPDIAARLVIPDGKNAGQHPSLASVYRALAEADATETPHEGKPHTQGKPHTEGKPHTQGKEGAGERSPLPDRR